MSYGAYLRELLRPLRIYGLEGTANGGELEAQGKALDGVEAATNTYEKGGQQRNEITKRCKPA